MLEPKRPTDRIIGLAIDVLRATGPGLLDSVYTECLAEELVNAGILARKQAPIPITYRRRTFDPGFRANIPVDNAVIVEVKAVAALTAIDDAQLLTYLRMSGIYIGLLFNFHTLRLTDGMRRRIV